MKPKTLLLVLAAFAMHSLKAQFDVTDITKINFFTPGVSYEKRVGQLQTLYGQLFTNINASYAYSSYNGTTTDFSIDPAITLQYRYYFNARRRDEKGKTTEMNNLNYIAPVYEGIYTRAPINDNYYNESRARAITRVGVVWGMQRNYPKHFALDLNLGIGYAFARSTYPNSFGYIVTRPRETPVFMGQLHLGFWLNKKKEK